MRPISFLVVALATTVAWAADIPVSSQSELAAAIASAAAGDTIVLADGNYDSTGLACNASGTAAMPITVKAAHPLKAIVRFTEPGGATEGFKVAGDYWHFEGLRVVGMCADDSNCEHGFHVNGASGFVLRGAEVVDFNAQVKVNAVPSGASYKLPQGGLIEASEFYDTRARNTSNPTTKLDLDSGDDWIVRGNLIHDFEKGGGDNVSYAAFLKCGGQRGLMERNLVLCARDFSGGTRLGLSLGGGGCAPQYCEPAFDAGTPCVEHHDGIVRNNIIVNCSDVGVYVNQSANSTIAYNTLIATAGIDFRFAQTSGTASGNVLAGKVRNRDSATATFANNLTDVAASDFAAWYVDPLHGDLRKLGDLSLLIGKGTAIAAVTDDYCARARSAPYDIGALQHSLGDCATTMTSTPDLAGQAPADLAHPPSADLAQPASDGGTTTTPKKSGCGCTTTDGAPATLVWCVVVALALRRTRGKMTP